MKIYDKRLEQLKSQHEELISRKNSSIEPGNGIYLKWKNPIITAAHTPLFWRYDFDPQENPFLMERQGVNAALNPGAIFYNGKYCLMVRVEGGDRKSFFALAKSSNGIDNFEFCDYPVSMPETDRPDVNVYDMRLTKHEDGWIYGVFCTERKDSSVPLFGTSTAEAQCGIARTKNLEDWERLNDLKTPSPCPGIEYIPQ